LTKMTLRNVCRHLCRQVLLLAMLPLASAQSVFPGEHWETRTPESLGMDTALLAELAAHLGGWGCVVKDGYVVHD